MLEYNDEAKRLVSTFLTYRNTVDIYTEDEEKDREFYKVLFARLIKSDIQINDVTPLGSKNNVIERSLAEPESSRKKIFIIDGDIAIINGKTQTNKNLFILEKYCIENYLFNKESVLNYIYISCGTKPIAQIQTELSYENWLKEYTTLLVKLFIHFAIIDYFGGNFTINNAYKYHWMQKGISTLNKTLIEQDIEGVKSDIIKIVGEEIFQEKYKEFSDKWQDSIDNLLTIVSGKNYLLPILLIASQRFKHSKASPSLEELKMNLVQQCNLSSLKKLKDLIEA